MSHLSHTQNSMTVLKSSACADNGRHDWKTFTTKETIERLRCSRCRHFTAWVPKRAAR